MYVLLLGCVCEKATGDAELMDGCLRLKEGSGLAKLNEARAVDGGYIAKGDDLWRS